MKMRVPFFRHDLGQPELDLVAEVLKGDILTTGEYVEQFENKFADYLGRRHVLGLTSCTGALHLSLLALGIGPGDEVITTPMSFIATATAVTEAGAKPVFVDVEPATGNLDMDKVEAAISKKTKAIIPVHLYGLMCDMHALRDIADRHGLRIIEDAAHCIEGHRDGVRPGDLSDVACFSFYATKNMTCGEGGALAVDDDELYRQLRLSSLHGMTGTAADRYREGYFHWDMVLPGWKYNMSNIMAAFLIPQLGRIEGNLARRQMLATRYSERLSKIKGLRLPATRGNAIHCRHIFPIWVDEFDRDALIDILEKNGIAVTVNYRPIHLMAFYAERYGFKRGDYPVAERIGDSTISIPFYPHLPLEHVDIVADVLESALGRAP